ncbi:ABC transporter ATP-binding protein [Ferroplasma sp.]|uniref:ABC transporter ATP-binding protein n=1 Tax=Ferroplasma sp. TaxID=2591003 RepID=UPI00307F33DA
MNNIIECVNLSKKYDKNFIFNNVNVKINNGINGFVGPNGYGKTTFIEMCTGLKKYYTGDLYINGKKPDIEKNEIGLVMDKPVFPENVSVTDYINIISQLYGKKPDDSMIDVLRLESVKNKKIRTLSAGYLKRLAFAVAIIHNPKIVFADEPFSNVDPASINAMKDIIMEMKKRGVSFLISSHDLQELVDIADNIFIIKNNKISKIERKKINIFKVMLHSDNLKELKVFLAKDFNINNENEFVIVNLNERKDIKKLFFKLSGFQYSINYIKTVSEKEEILSDVIKAIDED